ncbi:hypothetical protein E2320_022062, partial [Naja naja]
IHHLPGHWSILAQKTERCLFCRHGIAITLVTQYDIHLVHAIEEQI